MCTAHACRNIRTELVLFGIHLALTPFVPLVAICIIACLISFASPGRQWLMGYFQIWKKKPVSVMLLLQSEMCQVLRNEVRGQKFYQHQRIKVPIN